MDIKQEILGIPRALRILLEESRPQYEGLIRRAGRAEGPIYITGNSSSYLAGLTGAYAFESLLNMPVVVRPPVVFSAYASSALTSRALLIAISDSGECEDTLEAAKVAKNRGAALWALTRNPSSPLGVLADGIVPLPADQSSGEGVQSAFLQHATLVTLALAAGRTLKKPVPQLECLEKELENLPHHIEWVHAQILDAARALARELKSVPRLQVAGAGFYYPIALQASHYFTRIAGIDATGFDPSQPQHFPSDTGLFILSGSRCRLKAQAHQVAKEARQNKNVKVFAITDSNDHQVSERATIAVLLPVLPEPASALLSLSLLTDITGYATRKPVGLAD